jgi:hypothetical protein
MAKINRGLLVYRLAEHGSENVLYMKDKDLKYYVKDILSNLFFRYSDKELLVEIKLLDEIEEERCSD